MVKAFFYLLFFLCLLGACSGKPFSEPEPSSSFISFSPNQATALGHFDESRASFWEKPLTIVNLTYAFELSDHEVTQEEFETLLGFNPVEANNQGAQKPVVNVSWYDAVLYCNALSKKEGLDTVYQYSTQIRSQTGNTTTLTDLKTDFAVEGYRLPTEAEWNLAAGFSSGFTYPWGRDSAKAFQYAIYDANANGALSQVCQQKRTGKGFCDLAGNAAEWVQDWLDELSGVTGENYVGRFFDKNGAGKVVKGGAYSLGVLNLATPHRRLLYDAPPESRTGYIGFRVAKGSIVNPSFLLGNTPNSRSGWMTSSVLLVPTTEEIREFFGTNFVRLAAVDAVTDGLLLADFGGLSSSLNEYDFGDTIVRHPVISPDGNRIAFSTRMEGQQGNSQIYVGDFLMRYPLQRLDSVNASIPRFRVDPQTQDTLLIMVNQAGSNEDSSSWVQTAKTLGLPLQRDSLKSSDLFSFSFPGAFHSGFSEDGRYAVSGYTRLRVYDQETQQLVTRFTSPQNGKPMTESIQVCNASISSGSDPKILFIDFGSSASEIVGRPYGVHEILLVMDAASGQITNWFEPPADKKGWNFPEYSNHSNFAVATVTNAAESNQEVIAIRLSDGATLTLLRGEELWMPSLWIFPDAMDVHYQSSWDSIGVYFSDNEGSVQQEVNKSLNLWWQYRDSIQLAFLGSSRTAWGTVGALFGADTVAVNLGMAGVWFATTMQIASEYFLPLSPQLHTVVLEISPDLLGIASNFSSLLTTSPGYQYDRSRAFYQFDSLTENEHNALAYQSLLHFVRPQDMPRGDQSSWDRCGGWGEIIFWTAEESSWFDSSSLEWRNSYAKLKAFLDEAKQKNIRVLGVTFPQHPGFVERGYFGFQGGPLRQVQILLDSISNLQDIYSNFRWLDLNQNGMHGLDSSVFFDNSHLCSYGAYWATDSIQHVLYNWSKEN